MEILKFNHEYTGAEFNALHQKKLVKLTCKDEVHYGLTYRTGLNVDPVPFNPQPHCQAGGLYFCAFADTPMWMEVQQGKGGAVFFREVTVPDDARVFVEHHKFKADKIILGERRNIFTSKELFDVSMRSGRHLVNLNKWDTSLITVDMVLQAIQYGNVQLSTLPAQFRTEEVMRACFNNRFGAREILSAFSHIPVDDEMVAAMALLSDFDVSHLAPERRTRSLLEKMVKAKRAIQFELFPPEVVDETIVCAAIAARSVNCAEIPLAFRTKTVLMAAIQHSFNVETLLPLFDPALLDQEVYTHLVQHGGWVNQPDLVPAQYLTRDLLKTFLGNRYLCQHNHAMFQRFNPVFFDQAFYDAAAKSVNRIDFFPRQNRSRAVFDAYIDNERFSHLNTSNFPASFFDQDAYDRMVIENRRTIADVPLPFRSLAMLRHAAKEESIREMALCPASLFDAEAHQALLDHFRRFTYTHELELLPMELRTPDLLDLFVQKNGLLRTVKCFPDAAFTPENCAALLQAGYDFAKLPVACQTHDMWADAVRNKSVNITAAVPPAFRTQEMYELLVEHNANNISTVPREFLSERIMLTALVRDHRHLKHVPPAVRTPAVIALIQKNQARPKRPKRRDWRTRRVHGGGMGLRHHS